MRNEEANNISEDLITSVKEIKGEADHDWELGQLHQELPGGDTREIENSPVIIKSFLHLLITTVETSTIVRSSTSWKLKY